MSLLESYLSRIGVARAGLGPDRATLDRISEAHVRTIPFENLDVLLGREIRLDLPSLHQKLVVDRRGGYCFEQNALLLAMLGELGFAVRPISARVRYGRTRDETPPRTHLFVRVELDGETWFADVGVGAGSLTSAIRLAIGDVQPTPHEARRIEQEGARYFHQVQHGDAWVDVCEFTLEEMPEIDRVVANWYTSAHPQSHFRSRLIVARSAPDGERRTLVNREFSVRHRSGASVTTEIANEAELLAVLAAEFGLKFPVGTTFACSGLSW